MIFDLIMAGCVWFTLLFCYLAAQPDPPPERSAAGVTLPADAMELPEVQSRFWPASKRSCGSLVWRGQRAACPCLRSTLPG